MKRYQKQPRKADETYNPWEAPTIPEGAKVGIYARQSTLNQVKKYTTSQEMQTDDLIDMVKRMGVPDDDIILYLENRREDGTMKHASGRLRIDQREGLSALVERIESDEIRAVVVFMEDRLFRDETQIEVNKFILICKEHNTLVITPMMTYDFRNPYHVKQFRWKCEQAADYLREFIGQRLLGAKLHASAQGKYDGRTLTPGFIVDRRERIDGAINPNYKKYTIYEPHAEITRRIIARNVELGCNTTKLFRELRRLPVLYPDFEPWVDKRDTSRFILQKVPGGYHLSYKALLSLLTNVAVIGAWIHRDGIIYNNHPAIASENQFWFGFLRLSDFTPEGEAVERPNRQVRYNRENKPEAPALLKDIITTSDPKKVVYCGYRFEDWYYLLKWREPLEAAEPELYSILIEHVDQAFITKLLEHMGNTTDFMHFRQFAEQLKKEAEKNTVNIGKELARIERRMHATLVSLTEDPDMPKITRNALQQIYADLERDRNTLLQPQPVELQEKQVTDLLAYHNVIERLGPEWDNMDFNDRKLLAYSTAHQVELKGLSAHFMLLTIEWPTSQWETDTALLWRPKGRAPFWTDAEIELLGEHYPTTPQLELMGLLPRRSWFSIKQKASKLGVSREVYLPQETPDINLSLEDIQVMEQYGLVVNELSPDNQIIWFTSASELDEGDNEVSSDNQSTLRRSPPTPARPF